MEKNTSGKGERSIIPDGLNKWNWGAFFLTWIWGICNGSLISLLSLLPILNIIMPFYLGLKGNELAWKNKCWHDVDDLKKTQKKWSIAAWIVVIIVFAISTGVRIDQNKQEKESQRIADEIVEIIFNNTSTEMLLNNDYQIMMKDVLRMGTQNTLNFTMIIRSGDKIYFIRAGVDNNHNIGDIKINNSENDLEVIISGN